jgi:integrase
MKITKREIDRITLPTSGQVLYWDTELKGFGIRVTPKGISYVARSSVRGSTRRPRITLGRHGPLTPDMARVEARKALGEMAQGVDRIRVSKAQQLAAVTLDEAYNEYISIRSLASNTRHDYEKAMRLAFANWRNTPLAKITGGMVQRRFEEVSKRGPAQANQMFRFLRAVLGWAMWHFANEDDTPLIPANPCDILTRLKQWNPVRRRERHIAQEQLRPFMQAIEHNVDDSPHLRDTKDLCALLILTGLREQEGCRLLREDVDLNKRLITVRATKNGRDHSLPIGPWLARRLQERLSATTSSEYAFPAPNAAGHLLNHRKQVLAVVEASGVEFRLHDLRRTFATIVNHHLDHKMSGYTIKRLLNHSISGDVTAGYVQHPIEKLRQPMELVEDFVLRSASMMPSAVVHQLGLRDAVVVGGHEASA